MADVRRRDQERLELQVVGGITAGKQVACFRVIPKKNSTVPPKEIAQFFKDGDIPG